MLQTVSSNLPGSGIFIFEFKFARSAKKIEFCEFKFPASQSQMSINFDRKASVETSL